MSDAPTGPTSVRYVALGDSYTIGTAVLPAERWPDRLVAALAEGPVRLGLIANLAVDGSTTLDVLEHQLPEVTRHRPGFVSLLIGVNDVVRDVAPGTYAGRLGAIVDGLAAAVGAGRVLLVTTPDYTVTPAGADYGDPVVRARTIRAANRTMAGLATERGIALADVHALSLEVTDDPSLVAADGLHPSGRQYGRWVTERILPVVRPMLGLDA